MVAGDEIRAEAIEVLRDLTAKREAARLGTLHEPFSNPAVIRAGAAAVLAEAIRPISTPRRGTRRGRGALAFLWFADGVAFRVDVGAVGAGRSFDGRRGA